MSKQNIDDIDLKIKKLQEIKALLLERKEREIGKYILKTWSVNSLSLTEIIKLIDSLTPYINNESNENNA